MDLFHLLSYGKLFIPEALPNDLEPDVLPFLSCWNLGNGALAGEGLGLYTFA